MTVVLLAVTGITLSILASTNCRFLEFDNREADSDFELSPPFDLAQRGDIGIFSYRIREATLLSLETENCQAYNDRWGKAPYEVMTAAQFCGLFAPIFAGVALFITLFETCILSFCCSFLLSCGCFLIAAGLQAGTFSLYAEKDFW